MTTLTIPSGGELLYGKIFWLALALKGGAPVSR